MLSYSYISEADIKNGSSIPPRQVNGGRDTGSQATGPWGNVSVFPEPVALSKNLATAYPPPNAEKQPVTFVRPGNNYVEFPYHKNYKDGESTLRCII